DDGRFHAAQKEDLGVSARGPPSVHARRRAPTGCPSGRTKTPPRAFPMDWRQQQRIGGPAATAIVEDLNPLYTPNCETPP
ncbi:hypothetical protein, partial [Mycobacterium tuberculosis]